MKKSIPGVILFMLMIPVQADQATAMKSGCMGCHQPAAKVIGPSFKDIAAKHKGGDVEALVQIVKAGKPVDQLSWGGSVPMPPSQASEADVRKVIEWMLTH
jgi:cytochrome c